MVACAVFAVDTFGAAVGAVAAVATPVWGFGAAGAVVATVAGAADVVVAAVGVESGAISIGGVAAVRG